MSSLTEEQRRRIEENRRRALELRAAKSENNNATIRSIGQQPPPTPKAPFENRSNLSTTTTPAQNFYRTTNNVPPKTDGAPTPSTSSRPTPKVPPPPFGTKPISGVASLITRDRFKVDMTFHQQAIAIFKSISGAQYSPQSKTWNFPVSEHAKLVSSMECLKPSVAVGWLPSTVLKMCRTSSPQSNNDDVDLSSIDPILVRALIPFQKEGVIFGIKRNGRVLIADDMGLGKTIQALGIAHYYLEDWPLLIVAPSSMRYKWRESIFQWLPTIPGGSITILETGKDTFKSSKVVIVSYDLLQRRHEEFSGFKVVIIDESHHLKNFKTARTKAALPILQNAKRVMLLSGTPALSRPIELFPQITAISKYMFSMNDFGIRYCNGKKSSYGWDYSGSSNMQELNIVLAETIMIRRLKSEVLKELPPKFRKLVSLDSIHIKLTSRELQAKAQAFNDGKHLKIGEAEKRKRLLEYYSESAKVKLPAVSSYISDLVEAGKKFICFAHHRTLIDGICEYLESVKCKYIRIDGNSSSEDRQYCADQFQSRDDIRVAVLSIMAANSGLTLTAAGLVVFAELYWNPGILTQAEDRAHRIGQEGSVVVEYLLAKGTADDVLWPMVQVKLNTLNEAGLSKDNFHDATATGYFSSAAMMNTSSSSNLSQTSQQKQIQDYFTKMESSTSKSTENNVMDTSSSSSNLSQTGQQKQIKDYFTASTSKNTENNDDAFDVSAEDDAILMQMMAGW
ncbi:SWI/SNF-related matrix-associated actin-dependent regulator of chromatin subfamily A-like protein 1 [Folsomia candida]|uniref:SWI/SNF-related matrix-associated actin-dependent regulator of chromatin subfamily A-like protein 1 n=1 Tax=Folsomia candida TaxID=158441 RepID=A0A226DMB6_FOLCA|nr:SWI/SNF-related matrix-associated actin-dependent regulator of chromatin subfamily A-like protein 1 [Folsomia candida]OXA46685.1 SWI/SNF-related matrix-associated actin-dependent regulator of chromatin subfamily A-like protein 1 [Folsomia candida]